MYSQYKSNNFVTPIMTRNMVDLKDEILTRREI